MVWTLDRDINDIMGIVGFSPHPFLHVNIEMCKINSEGLSSLLHQCLIIRYKDHTIIHTIIHKNILSYIKKKVGRNVHKKSLLIEVNAKDVERNMRNTR